MAWVGVKDGGGVEVSSAAAKMLRFGRPILGSLNNGLISRGFGVGKIAIGLDQNVFALELELELELELFWSSVGFGKKNRARSRRNICAAGSSTLGGNH
jgi:hypothetical protein